MRIVVKGGVWKNTEDEILKAAVSKYGKNQWARISSLLVRKTPKQCKARWYEWLSPEIRKTEWSKEEDEKLLHLAKLMPTQWRTIAPIIGRTATQCLERYQKLLDDAEQREHEELGLTGDATGEAGPSADDVRRLRPGEVDPDPETKPARPDPIDMDEDEKEMLSEARARLANTQGKKAKRKARERQLEEARRLASLQKSRELRAAGILMRHKQKIKGMNYNVDIPFEKQPAPGFYDTTEERAKTYDAPIGATLRELEGPKRRNNEEDDERRKRLKRSSDANQAMNKNFQPEQAEQIQRLKEAQQISNRSRLNLPAPQVSERELEEIVKIGMAGENARQLVDEGANESGKGLLGEYSALGAAKNARTPRTAPQEDTVMLEARNIRNMSMAQTPLLGDENTPLHELPGRGTGWEGATPRGGPAATPNPLATPFRQPGADVSATPRSSVGAGVEATPLQTPMRDSLAINQGETPRGETPRDERRRLMQAKQSLKSGFLSLPTPKNDFELVDPEAPEREEAKRLDLGPEDAAERDERLAAAKAEQERLALARRSQAVKLNLPRPARVDLSALIASLQISSGDADFEVERQVTIEMAKLLEHDSVAFPVPGGSIPGGQTVPHLEPIPDEALAAARELVHSEVASAIGFPGASEEVVKRAIRSAADVDAFDAAWQPTIDQFAYDADTHSFVERDSLDEAARIRGLAALLDATKASISQEAEKATKTEGRLNKALGGYQARSKTLGGKLTTTHDQLERFRIEAASFEALASAELGSIPRRIETLKSEVSKLERQEQEGQFRYRELAHAKDDLVQSIAALEEEVMIREAEAINEAQG